MTMTELTELFGWMTLINIGLLVVATFSLMLMRDWVEPIHQRLFSLKPRVLRKVYMQYIAYYKIVVLVFNLTPYLALKIMGY